MAAGMDRTRRVGGRKGGSLRMSRRGLLALRNPSRSMALAGASALGCYTRDEAVAAATACFQAMIDEALNALASGVGSLPAASLPPGGKEALAALGEPRK